MLRRPLNPGFLRRSREPNPQPGADPPTSHGLDERTHMPLPALTRRSHAGSRALSSGTLSHVVTPHEGRPWRSKTPQKRLGEEEWAANSTGAHGSITRCPTRQTAPAL